MNFHQHNPRRTNIIHFRSILDITCHCHEFLLLGTHFPLAKRGILDLPTVPGGTFQHSINIFPCFLWTKQIQKTCSLPKIHPTQNSRKSQEVPTHWFYRGPLKSWDQKKRRRNFRSQKLWKSPWTSCHKVLNCTWEKISMQFQFAPTIIWDLKKNTEAKVSKISFQ